MINASEAREDDPEFQSPVDLMFERLEEKDPEHFAVRQYKKFLLSAGKTRSSILISCGARLAPFDIKELRDLMETDEIELDTIGDRKTALFVIISDTDDTFNFVVSILYTQLFNLLCDKADDEYGGRLPVHVRCLLDEFANIGQIPKFEKLIATIRSREISASIILQSQSQLKAIYKATDYRYKRIVRIVKNIKEDMKNSGIYVSDKVSSFGIESLLWNVDVSVYNRYTSLRFIREEIIGFLIKDKSNFSNYVEAKGIKPLFPDASARNAYESFITDLENYYEYEG